MEEILVQCVALEGVIMMWLARSNIKFKSRYLKAWRIVKSILVIMVRFLSCHY